MQVLVTQNSQYTGNIVLVLKHFNSKDYEASHESTKIADTV